MVLCESLPCRFIEVFDVDLVRALTFDNENTAMEIIFSVTNIVRPKNSTIEADFKCSGARGYGSDKLRPLSSGKIQVTLGLSEESLSPLATRSAQPANMLEVPSNKFYSALIKLGYHYDGPFVALNKIRRKLGAATGQVSITEISKSIIHPAVIDAAFQSAFLTCAAPGDNQLNSVYVPRRIDSILVDPALCGLLTPTAPPTFDASQNVPKNNVTLSTNIHLYPDSSDKSVVQVQGLGCIPLMGEGTDEDKNIFAEMVWDVSAPNDQVENYNLFIETRAHDELQYTLERMALFFLRVLQQGVPPDHPARRQGPYQHWFHFASAKLTEASNGDLPLWRSEWQQDTIRDIEAASKPYSHVVDVQLLQAVGRDIVNIATGTKLPTGIGRQENLLSRYYSEGHGLAEYNGFLARTARQVAHRYPRMHILEIGGGTGGATKAIFRQLGNMFSSYTFTDISSVFLEDASSWVDENMKKK